MKTKHTGGSRLSNALAIWVERGHSQKDFEKITGIDGGSCSLIFTGARGLTRTNRARVLQGFLKRGEIEHALAIIVADLRDNIPPEAADLIQIRTTLPNHLAETPARQDRVSLAKSEFQHALDTDDLETIELVLSLYDWRHQGKTPAQNKPTNPPKR